MKRLYFPLLAILILVLLCGCFGKSSVSESGTWELEFVSDTSGNIIAGGPDYTGFDGDTLDLSYSFDGKNFEVTNAGQPVTSGTYTKESAGDDTLALTLEYDNGATASAVVGVRTYDDGSSVLSMTIDTTDNIFSFLKAD